jgi:hypothetical protein
VKVPAYHTSRPETGGERDVYHDHSDCPDGRRIEPQHFRTGTAGRPRCKECIKLG